ncbi:MAG TPA: M36 family metallopeptidase [Solirubrobacteraceae bacterium]|nr:M36 family metallopeptidase [Solirubrobacteraceae bacterium]
MTRRSTLALAVVGALLSAPAATAAPPAALQAERASLGLNRSDIADAVVTDRYTDRDTGVTHVYLRQRHNGLDVIDGTMTLTLAPDGSVASVGDRFVRDLARTAPGSTPLRSAAAARSEAIDALDADDVLPGRPELVYKKDGAGLRLAWKVRVIEDDGDHAWDAVVDARDGTLLAATDWVSHAVAYNVFAPPLAGPDEGTRSIVVDPADPLASPFGWHDTDGVAGHESTLTIGNNVHAATDNDSNDVADAGSESDGGPGMIFDTPFDPAQPASANRGAAVTNLFYVVNHIHDVAYRYGFTEEAGNFQANNYGRGGLGGDAVDAHAVDGTFGTNNANFFTPPDGDPVKPRLGAWEFFEPQQPTTVHVEVLSPADIAGVKTARFGLFTAAGDVTAPIVLVDDGAPPLSDACSAMPAGSLTGQIALVDRGGCPFQSKANRVEAAGAAGMIVVQSTANPPETMNIDPNSGPVGIPAAMISRADGEAIKARAPGSVQGTLTVTIPPPPTSPSRASALDSTIVIHEYTHGISNRLTGGPANVGCLGNAPTEPSGMGEGWGDFLALALTQKPADTAETPRILAAYATFGRGIRDSPYSTDLAVDPATYDRIKQATSPHRVGWVWSSMLWDLHWKLGGDTAIQLVFDGMKIQPCVPGFVDARDAILVADELRNGGDNVCAIWQVFARRGLGAGATQGDPLSITDGTESFAVPEAACASPPPPSGSPPDQAPPSGGDPTISPRMTVSGRPLAVGARGRVTVRLACPGGPVCAGRVTLTTARRIRGARVRLGSARFTIAGGTTRRIAVKLSRPNRRLVRRLRRVRVNLEVSAADRATTRRTVWLTARR